MANYIIEKRAKEYLVYLNFSVPVKQAVKNTLSDAIKYVIFESIDPILPTIKFRHIKLEKETRNLIALVLREFRMLHKSKIEFEELNRRYDIYTLDDY